MSDYAGRLALERNEYAAEAERLRARVAELEKALGAIEIGLRGVEAINAVTACERAVKITSTALYQPPKLEWLPTRCHTYRMEDGIRCALPTGHKGAHDFIPPRWEPCATCGVQIRVGTGLTHEGRIVCSLRCVDEPCSDEPARQSPDEEGRIHCPACLAFGDRTCTGATVPRPDNPETTLVSLLGNLRVIVDGDPEDRYRLIWIGANADSEAAKEGRHAAVKGSVGVRWVHPQSLRIPRTISVLGAPRPANPLQTTETFQNVLNEVNASEDARPDYVKVAEAFIDEWLPGDEENVPQLAELLHNAYNAGCRAKTSEADGPIGSGAVKTPNTASSHLSPGGGSEEPGASITGEPDRGRWRVGRTLGRTLYLDDSVVGMVDSPELAGAIVAAMNRVRLPDDPRPETPEPDRPTCLACGVLAAVVCNDCHVTDVEAIKARTIEACIAQIESVVDPERRFGPASTKQDCADALRVLLRVLDEKSEAKP